MSYFIGKATRAAIIGCVALSSLSLLGASADAASRRHARRVHARAAAVDEAQPAPQPPQQQGVVGYFGGPFYGAGYGYGYGPGPYWGAPRPQGDLGFAILGALNGGGFRGFVECGNYYARTPGACGF